MSDSNSNGTATQTDGTTEQAATKQKREPRINRMIAERHTITDAATAQAYADDARETTRSEKASPMFNSRGFNTPWVLIDQDVENLIRMGASINDALAHKATAEGEAGELAANGLSILSDHSRTAAKIQSDARNARILAEADRIRAQMAETTGGKKSR